ncbi:aldehyde dehydrogenase family protein, partial [Vibrio parahaemolyticus]|nr:aldehyde dehydrogenase family protein [Vibrio parahaemolyticus]
MTFINNVQAEKSLYIAGEWQSGMDTIANINPSDISENIGDFSQASVSQVEQAIQA